VVHRGPKLAAVLEEDRVKGRRYGEVWEGGGALFVAVRRRNKGWDMLVVAGSEDEEMDPFRRHTTGDLVWWHDTSFRTVGYGRWEE